VVEYWVLVMLTEDIVRQLQQLGLRRGRDLPAGLPAAPVPASSVPVEGHLVDTGEGTCFLVEEPYALDHHQGTTSLGALLGEALDALADLAAPGETVPEPAGLVFLDIETTGLADGAGTYAFLVGLGRFEGAVYHLYQAFMRSPAEERALLCTVDNLLQDATGLVTFNGRGFDLPILVNRHRLARMPVPWQTLPHLDLLLPARRLFRGRLESCSLSSLERHILGVERSLLDIPGWRIPSVYHDYLRGADASVLEPIFYHNAQDVLSMVALGTRLARFLRDPFGEGGARQGLEFYALGHLYEQQGKHAAAVIAYRAALLLAMPVALRERTWERLSVLLKRQGDWTAAVEIWESLVGRPGDHPLYAYVELAKYYEHHSTDLARAEVLIQRAIAEHGACPDDQDLEHRLRRVLEKRRRWKRRETRRMRSET
jgi:uncharacterized protein YprB with RNaseH-like and TPR domain